MSKILVVTSRVPYPLDKGDKLRIYHQVKELSKKHTVLLCCLSEGTVSVDDVSHLQTICNRLEIIKLSKVKTVFNLVRAIWSEKPFQVHYFYQKKAHRRIREIIRSFKPDYIYGQLIRTAEYVKNEHHVSKTIDYMDAFSKGMERRIDEGGWLKPIVRSEAKRLVRYEHLVFDYFEKHTIISEEDRNFIFHQNRKEIVVIPNGIDVDFFKPDVDSLANKKYDLIFVGNMSYAPNVKAVLFLVNEVLPLLDKSISVLIAGASPSSEVKALESRQVSVSGWVEDIRMAYASAKVFVAPLFIGTGLQNKLLEAMAMELPCVTTPLVNKSLKAREGENIFIENTASEIALRVRELLNDDVLRRELGRRGRSFVSEKYSWKESGEKLENVICK